MDIFLTNAKDVIVLVLLFGGSIFIHEFGHFLMALKRGLVVDAFSIGFGPALFKWKRNGITYKISLLPLGGYVALPQLDPAGMDAIQGDNADEAESDPDASKALSASLARALPEVSPLDKILVSVAGPAGNIVFATILAVAIWLSPNAITYKGAPVVRDVDVSSKSYTAGLRPGDEILAVNGERVRSWYDFAVEAIVNGAEEPAKLLVYRGGDQLALAVPLVKQSSELVGLEGVERQALPCVINRVTEGSAADKAGLRRGDLVTHIAGEEVMDIDQFRKVVNDNIGHSIEVRAMRGKHEIAVQLIPQYSVSAARGLVGVVLADVILPWMQEKQPLAQMRADAVGIFRLLKALVTPKTSANAASGMGGPVMIIATLWLSIKVGLFNAFGFLRLLNVNLAIINLLPIPVLDGGHIAFATWEGLTRRKVHPKVVTALVNVFAVVLIILFGILTLKDSFSLKRTFGAKPKPAVETPATPAATDGDEPAAAGDSHP